MTWVCKMALCVTVHRDIMGVQYVSEILQLDAEIKVTDLHCSDIKRTVKIYSNTLHVYVCTNDRTEEEHVNIYWVTLIKIEGNGS